MYTLEQDRPNQAQISHHPTPPSHRWRLLAEAEHPGVSQAEGGDGGFGAQGGLVVTVPADAVVAVPVQVAQQGVEVTATGLICCLTEG